MAKTGGGSPIEKTTLPRHLVGNAGVFYVCYRLSQMGWNAMPTSRNAKGPDIVIASEDATRTLTVQVKSLSNRIPVALGKNPHIVGIGWSCASRCALIVLSAS